MREWRLALTEADLEKETDFQSYEAVLSTEVLFSAIFYLAIIVCEWTHKETWNKPLNVMANLVVS